MCGIQTFLYMVQVIVAYEAGHVCRRIYVKEQETKIFLGVGTLHQEKKDISKSYNILAPQWK